MMGGITKARLTPYEPPINHTGLHLFGPFHVKRGRGTKKVYVASSFALQQGQSILKMLGL